ncbi:MAG: molybdopterin-dependent oxidoreductase, partial [Myxococcota bacterium]
MTTAPNDTTRYAYRTCPLCEATCGLKLTVEGAQITRIEGDPDDVFSHGFICPKGAVLDQLHTDPDWLSAPMVREGTTWREVTWEEAFAHIAQHLQPLLKAHGPQSVGLYLGNPNVHNMAGSLYTRPLIKALGTRNIFTASTVDQIPKHVSSGLMFGSPGTIAVPDLDRTDLLLMLGANPWVSNGSLCTAPDMPGRLKAIRARGGRLIVVDPRRTRTARHADTHLFIRPGTDPWLLLALLHTLAATERIDLGPLAAYTNGLETALEAVATITPERAERHCGIPADTIRDLAQQLADAPSAAVYGRMGTHTAPFGTLASWAADALNIVTGNLDRPGGAMFARSAHDRVSTQPKGRGFTLGRWRSRVHDLPEAMSEFPVATLADEITTPGDGQIRTLITIAGNPVLSTPQGDRLAEALKGLSFMVSVDPYLNETTRHAHVILPPPTPLERSHYDLAFNRLAVRDVAHYSPPTFTTDQPDESTLLAMLALIASGQPSTADPSMVTALMLNTLVQREVSSPDSPVHGRNPAELLGQLDPALPNPEKVLDFMLRTGAYGDAFGDRPEGLTLQQLKEHPHGIDLGPLKPNLPQALSTPSGCIELAPKPIMAEIDRLLAEPEPDTTQMLLIGRRHLRSNNSWMHNIPALVRGRERCTLLLHPDDALRLGLAQGQQARVVSRVGELEVPVEVSDELMPGVVSLPHGWGHQDPQARL